MKLECLFTLGKTRQRSQPERFTGVYVVAKGLKNYAPMCVFNHRVLEFQHSTGFFFLFFLFEMVRDRRVLYRVQLTRPPLTELNQCAFTSDSYYF